MDNINWKEIEGFEGLYAISNSGQVKNIKRGIIKKSCPGGNQRGEPHYVHTTLWKNGVIYKRYIHRLVAEAFIPNPKNKPEVNHKDGKKLHNDSSNLEWVTQSENHIHALNTGLNSSFGETHYSAKLMKKDLPGVICLWRTGISCRHIAEQYGVSRQCISNIVFGYTRKREMNELQLSPA